MRSQFVSSAALSLFANAVARALNAARLLAVVAGACALGTPHLAQATLLPEEIERAVAYVCEHEKYIYAPERHLIQENCNYRFVANGARHWISYVHTHDLREDTCPGWKPWCMRPERAILIVVNWPTADNREEVIVEDAWGITPTFGALRTDSPEQELLFVARKEPRGPNDEGHPGKGYQYRDHWQSRFEDVLRLILKQASGEDIEVQALTNTQAVGR